MDAVTLTPIPAIGPVMPGADLGELITKAAAGTGICLASGDVVVVAQKVVSKSENRFVDLATIEPGQEAMRIAAEAKKDPRVVELVLRESTAVVRVAPGVVITRHRLGYVMANAGIDRSNVGSTDAQGHTDAVVLLPENPDASARRIRARLGELASVDCAVIVNDSFGRPWRLGTCGVAIGTAGIGALADRRGEFDLDGRRLETTEVAVADQIAAAASMLQGEGSEGRPVVVLSGLCFARAPDIGAGALIRPIQMDLFQ